jgi:D-alanyl-D-alanine dipeptidase
MGGTAAQNAAREVLHKAMLTHDFTAHPHEWWHFDYKNWQDFAVCDDSFGVLDGAFDSCSLT